MKHVKMLGLAIVAALALTAVVGAGTASATVICSTNPCGTHYASGTTISGSSNHAVLTTNIDTVTCTSSGFSGKTTTTGGANETVKGTISSLTFSGCTNKEGEKCNVSSVNTPYNAEVHASGKGNGTLTVFNGGAFVDCGSFINCTFTAATASLSVTGGTPATAKANGISLSSSGFLCPSTATWTATYTVTSPKSLFVL